ncbi:hypothetical protein [Streptomyces sp. NPDC005953]|uniref:hypothetical protein n=1 Tax=Streptomyces sp. NPDC005953 TaxID=3156719 RepID=UPI0033DDF010
MDLADPPGCRQLPILRNRSIGELACYRCRSTGPVPLSILVKAAGSRWRVEEAFQVEKGLAGLDAYVGRYPPGAAGSPTPASPSFAPVTPGEVS